MLGNVSTSKLLMLAPFVFFLNIPLGWVLYFNGQYLAAMVSVSIGTIIVFMIMLEIDSRDKTK